MTEPKALPEGKSVMDYVNAAKHQVANMEASEFFFLLMECRII